MKLVTLLRTLNKSRVLSEKKGPDSLHTPPERSERLSEAQDPSQDLQTPLGDSRGLLLELQLPKSPQFYNWFKGSEVATPGGDPIPVFHGTEVGEQFDTPRAWSHFGTSEAANAILGLGRDFQLSPTGITGQMRNMRIMPLYLNIKNPLKLDDYGEHNPDVWVRGILKEVYDYGEYPGDGDPTENILQVYKKYGIPPKIAMLYDNIISSYSYYGPGIRGVDTATDAAFYKGLTELMEIAGYDGIVYTNDIEDAGSTSWVPIHQNQIMSAITAQAMTESVEGTHGAGFLHPERNEVYYDAEIWHEKLIDKYRKQMGTKFSNRTPMVQHEGWLGYWWVRPEDEHSGHMEIHGTPKTLVDAWNSGSVQNLLHKMNDYNEHVGLKVRIEMTDDTAEEVDFDYEEDFDYPDDADELARLMQQLSQVNEAKYRYVDLDGIDKMIAGDGPESIRHSGTGKELWRTKTYAIMPGQTGEIIKKEEGLYFVTDAHGAEAPVSDFPHDIASFELVEANVLNLKQKIDHKKVEQGKMKVFDYDDKWESPYVDPDPDMDKLNDVMRVEGGRLKPEAFRDKWNEPYWGGSDDFGSTSKSRSSMWLNDDPYADPKIDPSKTSVEDWVDWASYGVDSDEGMDPEQLKTAREMFHDNPLALKMLGKLKPKLTTVESYDDIFEGIVDE